MSESIIDLLFHKGKDNQKSVRYEYLTKGLMNLKDDLEAKSELNINAVVNCVSCDYFEKFFTKWFPNDSKGKYKLKAYDICIAYMKHIVSKNRLGRAEFIESGKEWKPSEEEVSNKSVFSKIFGR